jgi:uncharacterized SAM-binding protein YcdF (DUF218 family)
MTVTGASVIAVLGYSRRADRALHPVCADRLTRAQELASSAGTVILSGEAEAMRAAWASPDVVLICDPDARSTADNARNVAAAARELGAKELVVVTSRWHQFRARILVRAALRGSGIRVRIEAPEGRPPLLLVVRELACFALVPFQVARMKRVVPGRAPRHHPTVV